LVVAATLAVSILGLAVNLAMAIGALAAVVTWRKQIQGTSQHDVAKRVAIGLQDVLTYGTALLSQWFDWRNADEARKHVLKERVHPPQAPHNRCRRTTQAGLRCVGPRSRAPQWSASSFSRLPAVARDTANQYDGAKPDGLWHKRFKEWIKFIDEWAMPYIGRGSVEPMAMEEFERRYAELSRPVFTHRRLSSEQPPSVKT
jgi:hypothetical protein